MNSNRRPASAQTPSPARKWRSLLAGGLALVGLLAFLVYRTGFLRGVEAVPRFDENRAQRDVETQLGFGARHPGTAGHAMTVEWILASLESARWNAEEVRSEFNGMEIRNILAGDASCRQPVVLGAHFDTREFADRDPDPVKRRDPVPGANDGASGVAVLLELARALPMDQRDCTWLVFFDAEDQGDIRGQEWIQGSSAFARDLSVIPWAVVIVDMIGDASLNIHKEQTSDPALTAAIWRTAESIGYANIFLPDVRYAIVDDHTPFLRKGIPASDIIDFDYPAWHTTADDLAQVSPVSLKAVGETLLQWLLAGAPVN